ncbi:MAG: DUF2177 family protein [Proteobacteria bacterium]|nr:DUF2177 family protein [Pseudomonadota bacterium]
MLFFLLAGVAALVVFLALDTVWISQVALPQFRAAFGDALLFRPVPGLLFYVLYIVGIVFFAIRPAMETGRWTTALGHGALLGLIAYGTYDLTNYATLKPYTLVLTLSDMAWGAVVTGAAAAAGFAIARRFIPA